MHKTSLSIYTNGMCTAICLQNLYGRTLDHHEGYGEQVVILPRRAPFALKRLPAMDEHFALVGMATMAEGVPLFYDGMNEHGLFMAGLLFGGYARYLPPQKGAYNVAPYELIPWILGQCPDLKAARALLQQVRLVDLPFSARYPLSPLHWILADATGCLVVEQTAAGFGLYSNPYGVLTNNPPFDYHCTHLTDYLNLSAAYPADRFTGADALRPYSRGMGAMGLPGDWSSASRFVRAAFAAANGPKNPTLPEFFHLLDTVSVPHGVALDQEGAPIITRYACCCDPAKKTYSFTTYHNRSIGLCPLAVADLDGSAPTAFDLSSLQKNS